MDKNFNIAGIWYTTTVIYTKVQHIRNTIYVFHNVFRPLHGFSEKWTQAKQASFQTI